MKTTASVALTLIQPGLIRAKVTYSDKRTPHTLSWNLPGVNLSTFKRLRDTIEGHAYAVTKQPKSMSSKTAAALLEQVLMPYEALFWLSWNDANQRPVKVRNLFNIVDDIIAGNWDPTTEPLALASDGKLINGMHRVLAVVLANPKKGVVLDIRKGAPRSKFTDVGISIRNPIDALIMSGHSSKHYLLNEEAPQKNMMLRAARRIHTEATGLKNLPSPVFGDILKKYGPDFMALGPYYRGKGGNSTVKTGDVLAALALAHHYLNQKKVLQCVECLIYNRNMPESSEHPLQKLSRYLIDKRRSDQQLLILYKVLSGIIPAVEGQAKGVAISKDAAVTLKLVPSRSELLKAA